MRKFVFASAAIALTAMLSGMAIPLTLTAQNPAVTTSRTNLIRACDLYNEMWDYRD